MVSNVVLCHSKITTQQTFTGSKSRLETQENGVKYVRS